MEFTHFWLININDNEFSENSKDVIKPNNNIYILFSFIFIHNFICSQRRTKTIIQITYKVKKPCRYMRLYIIMYIMYNIGNYKLSLYTNCDNIKYLKL